MQIEEQIFKRSYPSIEKLVAYGFVKQDENFVYTENLFDDTFKIEITITNDNQVKGKIYDLELDDEYIAYRIEYSKGEFVNKIKDYHIFEYILIVDNNSSDGSFKKLMEMYKELTK